MERFDYVKDNYLSLEKEIAELADRWGHDVTLVAVTKSGSDEELLALAAAGVSNIGENRPGELQRKGELLSANGYQPRLHEIGNLQRNKVKLIIDKVHLIHSLDSVSLAEEIDKQAKKHGIIANVLVEINSGGEESKGGIEPSEAEEFCRSLSQYDSIRLCGFMTMAPRCERAEDYYGYFNRTKALAEEIWHTALGREGEPILSMGMSESYCEAIECGATLVRVGRCMFAKES